MCGKANNSRYKAADKSSTRQNTCPAWQVRIKLLEPLQNANPYEKDNAEHAAAKSCSIRYTSISSFARCRVKSHASCGLTSRAQARGTKQREPRSGTGLSSIAPATEEDAIPRWLQRFVRLLCISYLEMPSSVKTICPTTVWQSTEDLQPTSALVALPIPPAKHAMREYLWWLLRTAPRLNLFAQNNANVWQTFRLYSC